MTNKTQRQRPNDWLKIYINIKIVIIVIPNSDVDFCTYCTQVQCCVCGGVVGVGIFWGRAVLSVLLGGWGGTGLRVWWRLQLLGRSCSSVLRCGPAVCCTSSLMVGGQTRCPGWVLSVLIDHAFLFRRSPHTESRSGSSYAPMIFFADLTTLAKSLLLSAVQPAYHTLYPWQRMFSIVLL